MSETQAATLSIKTQICSVLATAITVISTMAMQANAHADEMVISATRRDANAQEVPINISAISGEEIYKLRLNNAADLARVVPGLTSVEQGGRAGSLQIIRGLNVESLAASETYGNGNGGTVANYFGEIPVYIDLKPLDLERVEVLRGPQGTLYGANSLAGTIRYIPKKPDVNRFTIEGQGQLSSQRESSDPSYDANLIFNAPLIQDTLAFRAVLGYEDRAGFIDYDYIVREPGVSDPQPDFNNQAEVNANLRQKEDANSKETTTARLSALWNITDDLEATFYYHLQDQEFGGRQVSTYESLIADDLNLDTGDYTAAFRFEEPSDRKNQIFGTDFVWDFGFAEMTSAFGYTKYEEDGQRDQTDLLLLFSAFVPAYGYNEFPSFAAFTSDTNDTEIKTGEIRLVSKNDGPWQWIGGLFYYDAEEEVTSFEFVPGFGANRGINLTDDVEFFQFTDKEFKETAIFGEIGYDLTDQWNVLLGARYFETEEKFTQTTGAPYDEIIFNGAPDGQPLEDYASTTVAPRRDVDDTVFKVNTSYQFNNDILGYATVSEGYRPGGSNAIVNCDTGNPVCGTADELTYDADKTMNYEVGAKTAWFNGSLIVNAALFYTDWSDIQSQDFSTGGGIPITGNGEDAETQGIELDFIAQLSENWILRGQYGYAKAELSDPAPGIEFDSASGDRLPGSPEHAGSIFVDYLDTVGEFDLLATYGMTAQGDVFTTLGDGDDCCRASGEELPGFALHSTSVTLSSDVWSATLYIDNLYDKYAVTGVRPSRDFIGNAGDAANNFQLRRYMQYIVDPRTVGIEFRYKWGD